MGGVVEGISEATKDYFADENGNITSLLSRAYQYVKANLPTTWHITEEEKKAQDTRFAQFATFLAKPSRKEVYQNDLEVLDASGVIDLSRINRDDWPKKEVNYLALIVVNTYEKESYFLGETIVQDCCKIALEFKNRGFRSTYLCNPTARDFFKWVDFFSEVVKKEIFIYYVGMGTNVVDPYASARGEITQILVFRDDSKRADGSTTAEKGPAIPKAVLGLTTCTLSENYILDLIERAAALSRRTVFVFNCFNNLAEFVVDKEKVAIAKDQIPQSACSNKIPPYNTITMQYNTSNKTQQHAFNEDFYNTLRADAKITFRTFKQKYVSNNNYQRRSVRENGGLTICPHRGMFSSASKMLDAQIIPSVCEGDMEMQLEAVTSEILGTSAEEIVALPDPYVLTQAEIDGANKRWEEFAAEMKKSPNYNSAFKAQLKELDGLGCINLQRINRAQIPDLRIDRGCALFFCPYEGLKHTLGIGPINDALTMARLYIAKGYKVMYLMDATPKEYYSWMDWILSNIHYEIVSYFSGHGTQTPDITGLEDDGMSELMVFFNEDKKEANIKEIKSVVGVDEQTVADYTMHDLIILKDYPETRIVLISDCCHSGTMFNFDHPVPVQEGHAPLKVIHLGAARDEQTAKQVTKNGKESGIFTQSLSTLIENSGKATFLELEKYTKENIKQYQEIVITTTNYGLLSEPIIAVPKYIDGHLVAPADSSSSSSSSSISSPPSSSSSSSSSSKV